jgi:hypothetical protein
VVGRLLGLRKLCIFVVAAATMSMAASSAVGATRLPHSHWPTAHRVFRKSYLADLGMRAIRRPMRSPRARASIVDGDQIAITQAPWQVFVVAFIPISDTEYLVLLCGGSIIDETHVVTAGHCMFDPETNTRVPAKDVLVVAGTSNIEVAEPEEQEIETEDIRVHPYFEYSIGAGAPDDIAVLTLSEHLKFDSSVQPISLAAAAPGEGAQVNLTGFGRESPSVKAEGPLHSLGMTVGFSRPCGGEADAVFVCASSVGGSGCAGDSGSGLTSGSIATLVGVMDTDELVGGESCLPGTNNGFVNIAAPEIRDFIEGSETPPRAPRGGGAVIRAVLEVGHAMTCEPGLWTGSPTFVYTFVNSVNQQTLQSGPSQTYQLTAADVGRTIYCQVSASNSGGTGMGRTPSLSAIKASPSSSPTPAPSNVAPAETLPTPSFPSVLSSPTPSSVLSLGSVNLTTQSDGLVTIELMCEGEQPCSGKLTLEAEQSSKGKHGKRTSHLVVIGHFSFSLLAEGTGDVKSKLNELGLTLLRAAHGRLAARLRIAQLSGGETEMKTVHLDEVVPRARVKKKRAT